MQNNTTEILSLNEMLLFMLPVIPLSAIGVINNTIVIVVYARFKTLRAEGGIHMITLMAGCDLLSSLANMQVSA